MCWYYIKGFINFKPERRLSDYPLYELSFKVPDYEKVYYEDKYLVIGRLPTSAIYGAMNERMFIFWIVDVVLALESLHVFALKQEIDFMHHSRRV